MMATGRPVSFLRLEYTVRRKSTVSDTAGGRYGTWADLPGGKVQGSELAPQTAREQHFTQRLEVRRQMVLWVDDTAGILSSDRIRDPAGQEWEIIGLATHGPLKQLRLVEARD